MYVHTYVHSYTHTVHTSPSLLVFGHTTHKDNTQQPIGARSCSSEQRDMCQKSFTYHAGSHT